MIKKIICVILCLSIIGCSKQEPKDNRNKDPETVVDQTKDMNTWVAYWDSSGSTQLEISNRSSKIKSLCYFGAYYKDGKIFIPDGLMQYYQKNKKQSYNHYLTIINDVSTDASSSLKEEAIVAKKLRDEQSINQHIQELVQLVKDNDFDGLELDYENFNDHLPLWKQYTIFIDKLYTELQKENKGLRVLLEPKSPIEYITLPKGPTYVMMCYNLYGGFSEPGPKADQIFLQKLKEKTKSIENIEYALAAGGFQWGNSKVSNVSVEEALQLADQYEVKPIQDQSGAWHFTYQKDNNDYTIWYGDEKTMEIWKETLGVSTISLWKMGGNNFSD